MQDRNWTRRRGKGHAQRRRLEAQVEKLQQRLSDAGRQRQQERRDLAPPRALLDTDRLTEREVLLQRELSESQTCYDLQYTALCTEPMCDDTSLSS